MFCCFCKIDPLKRFPHVIDIPFNRSLPPSQKFRKNNFCVGFVDEICFIVKDSNPVEGTHHWLSISSGVLPYSANTIECGLVRLFNVYGWIVLNSVATQRYETQSILLFIRIWRGEERWIHTFPIYWISNSALRFLNPSHDPLRHQLPPRYYMTISFVFYVPSGLLSCLLLGDSVRYDAWITLLLVFYFADDDPLSWQQYDLVVIFIKKELNYKAWALREIRRGR